MFHCGGSALAVASKSNDAEKENFTAQVEWLPLTSRSQIDGLTDKSKISIMIAVSRCGRKILSNRAVTPSSHMISMLTVRFAAEVYIIRLRIHSSTKNFKLTVAS